MQLSQSNRPVRTCSRKLYHKVNIDQFWKLSSISKSVRNSWRNWMLVCYFTVQIKIRFRRSTQQLGIIKRVLYDALKKNKATGIHNSLQTTCGVRFNNCVGSIYQTLQSELDIVKNSAIRFICKLKVRSSVTQVLEQGCSTGGPGAGCGPPPNFIRPPESLPV